MTGSKTLLDTADGRVLVDCGLFQGRKRPSKHDPDKPLYSRAEAVAALELLQAVPFDSAHRVLPGVEAREQSGYG